ncbi:hypothetical protein [Brevibacillus sp. NRS-1366]|uniref:hypothetical protein n=1 Tax=Brevibacillus sp. NRS-1366 TaxID=3233899 RepID=UPI003D216A3E
MRQLRSYICILFLLLVMTGCGDQKPVGSTNSDAENGTIPLTYEPVKVDKQVMPLKKEDIQKIVKEVQVDQVKVIAFTKPNESDILLFGGIQIGTNLYEIGDIGAPVYSDQLQVKTSSLFKQSVIDIGGLCGANCSFQYYLTINNNVPSIFLYLNSPPSIVNLDQDGIEAIITSYGSPNAYETVIYTIQNNQLVSVNLNKALNARSVLYTDPTFVVQMTDNAPPQEYKYTKNGLVLLQK